MRPAPEVHEYYGSPPLAQTNFAFDTRSQAHLMQVLRQSLYSDPLLAILREYITNGMDAHVAAGCAETPVRVSLPTFADPVLRVRDFGLGLSHEQVYEIVPFYGKSTKRETDTQHGMMGVGIKSGFAYTNNFLLTSWQEGMKRVYAAALDVTGVGTLSLQQEIASDEPAGVEVSIGIEPKDFDALTRRAQEFISFFDVKPVLLQGGVPLEAAVLAEHWRLPAGYLFKTKTEETEWGVVMGGVFYRAPEIHTQLTAALVEDALDEALRKQTGVLLFAIGELDVAASRETVRWTPRTVAAIAARFRALCEQFVAQQITMIPANASDWDKRCAVLPLERRGLPIPPEWLPWAEPLINLPESLPFTLFEWRGTQLRPSTVWRLHELVKVYSRASAPQNGRTRCTSAPPNSWVFCPNEHWPRLSHKAMLEELRTFFTQHRLTGLPIVKFPRASSARAPRRVMDTSKPYSRAIYDPKAYTLDWKEEEPVPGEVYQQVYASQSCQSDYVQNLKVLAWLGVQTPPVYFYKVPDPPAARKTKQAQAYYARLKQFHAEQEARGAVTTVEWVTTQPFYRAIQHLARSQTSSSDLTDPPEVVTLLALPRWQEWVFYWQFCRSYSLPSVLPRRLAEEHPLAQLDRRVSRAQSTPPVSPGMYVHRALENSPSEYKVLAEMLRDRYSMLWLVGSSRLHCSQRYNYASMAPEEPDDSCTCDGCHAERALNRYIQMVDHVAGTAGLDALNAMICKLPFEDTEVPE